jgi:hypothetical protein
MKVRAMHEDFRMIAGSSPKSAQYWPAITEERLTDEQPSGFASSDATIA